MGSRWSARTEENTEYVTSRPKLTKTVLLSKLIDVIPSEEKTIRKTSCFHMKNPYEKKNNQK